MITDNALKNYTTKIDPMRTAAEIDYILASNGATAIQKDITNGQITALRFTVQTSLGLIPIQLPVNVEAVQQILKKMREQKVRTNIDYSKEQAARVAWRCLKSWVEAQMALIQIGMATMDQVFLPYVLNDEGKTLYEVARDSKFLLKERSEL